MGPEGRHEELELARRAAAGEEAAWRRIYDLTSDRLFNLLCWQTGDREAARDLLQETYLAAAGGLGGFAGEAGLLGWLRAIALHRAQDWRRTLWRRLRKVRALRRELLGGGAGGIGRARRRTDPDGAGATAGATALAAAAAGADQAALEASLEVAGRRFQRCLHRLSASQRAALLLRELEDLSFAEIGRELGCGEATARVHHHRAVQRMRSQLGERPEASLAAGVGGQES